MPEREKWAEPNPRGLSLRAGALLFGVTLLAYFPAITGGFVWDDDGYVTKPALRSLHGLWRIWFDLHATEQYYPLLHTAFWLEHRVWGDSPLGYHLVNVLLHATAACLFAAVLRKVERLVPKPLAWEPGVSFGRRFATCAGARGVAGRFISSRPGFSSWRS